MGFSDDPGLLHHMLCDLHVDGMQAACVGDASRAGAGDYNMKSVKDLLEIL